MQLVTEENLKQGHCKLDAQILNYNHYEIPSHHIKPVLGLCLLSVMPESSRDTVNTNYNPHYHW